LPTIPVLFVADSHDDIHLVRTDLVIQEYLAADKVQIVEDVLVLFVLVQPSDERGQNAHRVGRLAVGNALHGYLFSKGRMVRFRAEWFDGTVSVSCRWLAAAA
jgi:hypothetical protein